MSGDTLIPRGNRLEYLVAAAFQAQSYLVRRAVPLKYGPAGLDATDIDVLGIKFTEPFQPHRIICDCKDRQRSRPYERIFWEKGLSAFVDATETYVAVPRANSEIIKFARKGQVRVVTQDVLDHILTRVYGEDWKAYGIADGSFFEPLSISLKPTIESNRNAAIVLQRTRMAFIVEDPYPALNQCLDDLRLSELEMRRMEGISPGQVQLWRLICAENIVLFSVLVLYIASDTVGLTREDRSRHITERLTYGDISPQKAQELFRLAQRLVIETVKSVTRPIGNQALSAFELGDFEAPKYAADICGLVERAIASPRLYHSLPQIVDYLVFGQGLSTGKFVQDEYVRTFPYMAEPRLKAAKNVFSVLRDHTGVSLNRFWADGIQRGPAASESPTSSQLKVDFGEPQPSMYPDERTVEENVSTNGQPGEKLVLVREANSLSSEIATSLSQTDVDSVTVEGEAIKGVTPIGPAIDAVGEGKS